MRVCLDVRHEKNSSNCRDRIICDCLMVVKGSSRQDSITSPILPLHTRYWFDSTNLRKRVFWEHTRPLWGKKPWPLVSVSADPSCTIIYLGGGLREPAEKTLSHVGVALDPLVKTSIYTPDVMKRGFESRLRRKEARSYSGQVRRRIRRILWWLVFSTVVVLENPKSRGRATRTPLLWLCGQIERRLLVVPVGSSLAEATSRSLSGKKVG
jgi:hypothetical protein